MKVSAGLVSSEAPLLGLWKASFSLCPLVIVPLWELCLQISSVRTPVRIRAHPNGLILTLLPLLKILALNTVPF